MSNNYPKYQISVLRRNGREVQEVYRTDDLEEFEAYKKLVYGEQKPAVQATKTQAEFKEDVCTHGECAKTRFYKHEKEGNVWYSHKGDDGKYHNLKV